MELTRDDIRKVAELAKLHFSDDQLAEIAEKFGRVLHFVEQLEQVETDGVQEMAHPFDVHSVVRADENRPGVSRGEALSNAPSSDGEFFLVPPVMAKKS